MVKQEKFSQKEIVSNETRCPEVLFFCIKARFPETASVKNLVLQKYDVPEQLYQRSIGKRILFGCHTLGCF